MKNIPGTKHYAIITKRITYDNIEINEYTPYTNKNEWEEKIKSLTHYSIPFTAIQSIPMDIIKKIEIIPCNVDEQF